MFVIHTKSSQEILRMNWARRITMKQRKLSGTNYSSCSDECNGHVNNFNFKRANHIDDECRSTNGNHIRPPHKIQIKSDKPKKIAVYDAQMNNRYNNRSQQQQQQQQWCWCQRFYDESSKIVQNCSLRIRPNYCSSTKTAATAKFAFHQIVLRPIVIVFVLLLFSVQYCVANGQHIESQWNAKNTGEWVIFTVHNDDWMSDWYNL